MREVITGSWWFASLTAPRADLDQIGAQNQTEYRLAPGGAPSGDLPRRSDN